MFDFSMASPEVLVFKAGVIKRDSLNLIICNKRYVIFKVVLGQGL